MWEVSVPALLPHRPGVVAFGDSTTDGAFSTADANNRSPDELAERLAAWREPVLNAVIGGNRVLNDSRCAGEVAVARFRRDALGQPEVGSVLILAGVDDIGLSEVDHVCAYPNPEVTAQQLIEGDHELIRRARAGGGRVIGATLLPFKGSHYCTGLGEAVRDELKERLRTSGKHDAVVDFERALADPRDPDVLAPEYDSGDRLHPNGAGYHAMAEAVDPFDL